MKEKYKVTTETKGILTFTEFPENTYFAIGNIGNEPQSEPGKAYLFTIKDIKTDQSVIIPENAGKQIKNGQLIPA
jgi:hypothetical protein